ncbi:hypothetical protein MATL_G00106510 [Megalops atlanticus]|uniref:Uncharacterized protein n=1 Tax=Megalops atlanticus TaxID=7932 RepID=A0A9D3T6C7_MEGAT|nr:hypothetical protein MATL_G00106510 [Megalops atlanticus]
MAAENKPEGLKRIRNPDRMYRSAVCYGGHAPPKGASDVTEMNISPADGSRYASVPGGCESSQGEGGGLCQHSGGTALPILGSPRAGIFTGQRARRASAGVLVFMVNAVRYTLRLPTLPGAHSAALRSFLGEKTPTEDLATF